MSYGMNGWNKEIPGGDTISRAAAIDELDKGAWGVEWDKTLAKTMIESLPSAQLTQNTRVNSNNALDTISREAAIDALGEKPLAWMESEYAQGLQNQWVWDVNALKALPSAQPELIRCKNCKHNQLPSTCGNANCEIFYGMTDQDGFCHMAERRTDDQT